ncbi:hypothetical protein CAAN1_19S00826 [[Candida] anglica]|uniref:Uncharacterized protein n=1 Tax=[Candida] anglica TaxID=148631 RepID=A0ABP0E5N5_9ASCO
MTWNVEGVSIRPTSSNKLSLKDIETIKGETPAGISLYDIVKCVQRDCTVDDWLVIEVTLAQFQGDLSEVASLICNHLDIKGHTEWDWLDVTVNLEYYHPLRVLRNICGKVNDEVKHNIIVTASYHIKPNLPWTSPVNCQLSQEIIDQCDLKNFDFDAYVQFQLTPNVLQLSKTGTSYNSGNSKISSVSGYRKSSNSYNGLNPILGFSQSSSADEDQRHHWRTSQQIKSLSMVWWYIRQCSDKMDRTWPLVTSFTLNVLEDHNAFIKAQGCEILDTLIMSSSGKQILIKSGLLDLFIDATKVCLSYLPTLTPEDTSYYILERAYPVVLSLTELKINSGTISESSSITPFITVVNENILASIQRIRGGDSKLLCLLIEQLKNIISEHLGYQVLATLSRVLFTINQVMVDPTLFDKGAESVEDILQLCLEIQTVVFEEIATVVSHEDLEGLKLIVEYRYDFLGVWSIVYKRIRRDEAKQEEVIETIRQNLQTLRNFATKTKVDLEKDITMICEDNRDLEGIFREKVQVR